jgi:2-polyprenyl-3-methyl-5-hydroxy-6-metoxy-1,4-benzoquinol methylase
MVGLNLVRPLEDDWRDTLDHVAKSRRWPTSHDVDRLASCVAALSQAYNDPAQARALLSEAGPARLGFSFVRDVPKGAAATRELIAAGAVRPGARILDVGAGLGAMTWGIVRALRAAGSTQEIEATWIDEDRAALDVGLEILRARRDGSVRARAIARRLENLHDLAAHGLGRFDLVVVGNVLSEVDVPSPDEARVSRHVEILRTILDRCLDDRGALIVVEPALRDRTRRLHRVRDALMELGYSVLAPCLHSSACPALTRESDWCHEDLPVDLPEWVAPVARAAGLRRQGLTFSYLILARSGTPLAAAGGGTPEAASVGQAAIRLRVVSERRVSKGKSEAFLCGEFRSPGAGPAVARARVMRLDRDIADANAAWSEIGRGDVLEIEPSPALERPRIDRATFVRRLEVEAGVAGGTPRWTRGHAQSC